MRRLALAVLYLEFGLVLLVAPWSRYWDRNYFSDSWPRIRAVASNNFVRGAVSGLGLVNAFVAVTEIGALLFVRRATPHVSVLGSSSAEDP